MELNKKKFAGAILMDLSNAFDCLNRELLIAQLNAYGLDRSALEFIYCLSFSQETACKG